MNRLARATKITILVDNNVTPGLGLLPEHGFSALVERGDCRILFDTGQGQAIRRNSEALGIKLSPLDAVVLSHGHYDHTGGLLHVAEMNPGVEVVAHPNALGSHLVKRETDVAPREIGIPHGREAFAATGARFRLTAELEEIFEGVWFTGSVPRKYDLKADGQLLISNPGGTTQDIIPDDASLVISTPSGHVLLFGCAHAGVRNILEHVREKLGIRTIHAVVGGTHLGFCEPGETGAAIRALKDFGVKLAAPAHCTGDAASSVIKAHFKDGYRAACAGTVLEF